MFQRATALPSRASSVNDGQLQISDSTPQSLARSSEAAIDSRIISDVTLIPNHEVHSTFWVPVSELRDPARATEHVFERGGARMRFPAYRSGDDVVWGMTERIVTQLLAVASAVE